MIYNTQQINFLIQHKKKKQNNKPQNTKKDAFKHPVLISPR